VLLRKELLTSFNISDKYDVREIFFCGDHGARQQHQPIGPHQTVQSTAHLSPIRCSDDFAVDVAHNGPYVLWSRVRATRLVSRLEPNITKSSVHTVYLPRRRGSLETATHSRPPDDATMELQTTNTSRLQIPDSQVIRKQFFLLLRIRGWRKLSVC
jgi:hypothetical protein